LIILTANFANKVRRLSAGCGLALAAALLLHMNAAPGFSQNFGGDARWIAMGSVGEKNMALDFAGTGPGQNRSYRSIPVPLGLLQILRHPKIFDPGDPDFNPLRAMEYAANPIHYTILRNGSDAGEQLVTDLVNGQISRDLNTYRGFIPKSNLKAAGLVDPTFGKTFRFLGDSNGPRHGIYVGAGPYLSVATDVNIDQGLVDLLASDTDTYAPNSTFKILDTTAGQVASALTTGYRVRIPVSALGRSASRPGGVYFAANYNYLYGLHYDTFELGVQFDTDNLGLVTIQPSTVPLSIDRVSSSSGHGRALDFASGVTVDRWVFGFAANGISNYIDWKDLRAEKFELSSIMNGASFTETDLPSPAAKQRVELPVRYSGSGGYTANRWSAQMEVAHGLKDYEVHGGGEYRLALLDLRAGSHYSRSMWHPSGGIGLNLTEGFGIDVATFTTASNIERKRKATLAVSLRFGR
jgi:hypothetical protein